ncbi:putative sodium/metabolite cotransporter BASS1, chloroplastic [Porphyridium purpureum]|uniref:Putative sodium/metabolite cotransporter BASS1, chloroplastic n=1 Tax=Porphyridium purpureum TaxID=35688 RepID=A0A5J4YXA3_PORPP|nr:putative sodium/metabolite cotransporter BASS1, chloroplastic [Porphyridium purpureum]|eukprot:POR2972..scf209_3
MVRLARQAQQSEGNGDAGSGSPGMWTRLEALVNRVTQMFPLWVLSAAALAVKAPGAFSWFTSDYLMFTLYCIMLGMGLTTDVNDFKEALNQPKLILLGAVAQYTLMPSLGWLIGSVLKLPTALRVGVCLVATAPGGTASNLVCLLGGADVALSIIMTLTTTCMATVMSPYLMKFMVGTIVPVSAIALFKSILMITIAPLVSGALLKRLLPAKAVAASASLVSLGSVVGVTLICGSIVSANAQALLSGAPQLVMALLALHAGGFLLGYTVSRLLGQNERVSRTISIEVGMQNSGLAAALAQKHFAASPETALPAAISATIHSIMGSLLAAGWKYYDSWKSRAARDRE